MSRKKAAIKREINPDAKYGNLVVAKFICNMMISGKKSIAEGIMYKSLDVISDKLGIDPVEAFEKALANVRPMLEVRSRRVGGATYQVPVEVRPSRSMALAMRWLISCSRSRKSEKTMYERLAVELMEAYNGRGESVKKRDNTHKMAEANRAFAHYKW
jgi:small subunit ribosomal protein S7